MSQIQQIEIPEYITKIKTSDEIQPIYYGKYDSRGTSKTWTYDDDPDSDNRNMGSDKYDPIREEYDGPPWELEAPKTKILKLLKGKYDWNSQGYLVDENGDRLVSNPRRAGKASYDSISGNRIISSNSTGRQAKYKNRLKDFYRPFIEDQLEPIPDDKFPIGIEWEVYTVPDRNANLFDLSNLWFYKKYFEDVLFEVDPPIIPDDNIKYITWHQKKIIPVNEWENRKFIFKFLEDNRKDISKDEFWND